MAKARVTRTSSDSATCEPIVLRDGGAARLVFAPIIATLLALLEGGES